MRRTSGGRRMDPIVLIADEDWDALNHLGADLHHGFYVLYARNAGEVSRFAEKFCPSVILVDEHMRFGRRGAERFVPFLLERFDAKVIVLTEEGDDDAKAQWRKLGATDCLLHPTKYRDRTLTLNRRILDLTGQSSNGDHEKTERCSFEDISGRSDPQVPAGTRSQPDPRGGLSLGAASSK